MDLIAKINAALDAGKTVTVASYLRVTSVKPKHRATWRAAGFEFFKTDADGAALMIDGQSQGKPHYSRIGGNKVTAA
jgi:hypothetical protein